MKKFFAMLIVLIIAFSTCSIAFATNYNWGREPVTNKKYTIHITKYEVTVDSGKLKFIENPNITAKRKDNVYFSFEVYNGDGKDVTAEHIGDMTFSGIKATPTLIKGTNIYEAIVYTDAPYITARIETVATIDELIRNGDVAFYGSFVKIGNILFERDINNYVIGAFQYDKSLDEYLARNDYTPARRIKATEAQVSTLGMSLSLITEGVYLVDANTIVKNLGVTCLAEQTVYWGKPAVVSDYTVEIPKTGDKPSIIGFVLIGAVAFTTITIVTYKKVRKNSAA